jgi:hypothetical protein
MVCAYTRAGSIPAHICAQSLLHGSFHFTGGAMNQVVDFQSVLKAKTQGFNYKSFKNERQRLIEKYSTEDLSYKFLELPADYAEFGTIAGYPNIKTEDLTNPAHALCCQHDQWSIIEMNRVVECDDCSLRMYSNQTVEDECLELQITYQVRIDKNRIDDQKKMENREWCLYVFDRSEDKWTATNSLSARETAQILEIRDIGK